MRALLVLMVIGVAAFAMPGCDGGSPAEEDAKSALTKVAEETEAAAEEAAETAAETAEEVGKAAEKLAE